jgi:hypothetical protein
LPTVQSPTILKVDNPITAQVIDLNNQMNEMKELLSGGVMIIQNSKQANQGTQNSQKIGYTQNQNNNPLAYTGCENETQFVQKYDILISDLANGITDSRTLCNKHLVNLQTISYAKNYLLRNAK